jgi:hypothetical protein
MDEKNETNALSPSLSFMHLFQVAVFHSNAPDTSSLFKKYLSPSSTTICKIEETNYDRRGVSIRNINRTEDTFGGAGIPRGLPDTDIDVREQPRSTGKKGDILKAENKEAKVFIIKYVKRKNFSPGRIPNASSGGNLASLPITHSPRTSFP